MILSTIFISLIISTVGQDQTLPSTQRPCSTQLAEISQESMVTAAKNFREFFAQNERRILERDYVYVLMELALLGKMNVLLLGVQGTAKTQLTRGLFDNITFSGNGTRASSFYEIQMSSDTTRSDTHGPIDPKALMERGEYARRLEEGASQSHVVFFDEIFDIRPNALRDTLGLIERGNHFRIGNRKHAKINQVNVAASNYYLTQVYNRYGPDRVPGVTRRYPFVVYVPGEIENLNTMQNLIDNRNRPDVGELKYEDLKLLQDLVDRVVIPQHVNLFIGLFYLRMKQAVEGQALSAQKKFNQALQSGGEGVSREDPIFYRPTREFDPSILMLAAEAVRIGVVKNWIDSGSKIPLVATIDDLDYAKKVMVLNGPKTDFLKSIQFQILNLHQANQVESLLWENEKAEELITKLKQGLQNEEFVTISNAFESFREATEFKQVEDIVRTMKEIVIAHQFDYERMMGSDFKFKDLNEALIASVAAYETANKVLAQIESKFPEDFYGSP